MAIHMLRNASVVINSVDLSDHVQSCTVDMTAEDVDVTAMGATSRAHLAGLRDDAIQLTVYQDFAASKVDQTLSTLVGSSGFSVVVKPDAGTTTTTNPSYTATCIMLSYTPVAGGVGDANMTDVEFRMAQGSSITRATG